MPSAYLPFILSLLIHVSPLRLQQLLESWNEESWMDKSLASDTIILIRRFQIHTFLSSRPSQGRHFSLSQGMGANPTQPDEMIVFWLLTKIVKCLLPTPNDVPDLSTSVQPFKETFILRPVRVTRYRMFVLLPIHSPVA